MTIRIVSLRQGPARLAGFTLIEILLVIVIILMLAGALVVFVLPQQEGAEKNTTKLLLNNVGTALDHFRLNVGHYPTEDEGGLDALLVKPTFENERLAEKWQGPYLKPGTRLEDPWGNKLRYEPVDRTLALDDTAQKGPPYKLYSVGPDGQPETEDDIKLMPDETDALTDTGMGSGGSGSASSSGSGGPK
jgi:general secretion pathway protein G